MNYTDTFRVSQQSQVKLTNFDPAFTDKHETKRSSLSTCAKLQEQMHALQYKLYAEQKRSILICLQALDAGGKDGVVRHVMSAMNMQGCRVVSFKEPSKEELSHDFLWRIQNQTPKRGEIVVFNRSQYEDVLIVRVHELVPKSIWTKRFELINNFENELVENGTSIIKIFLHISKEEQLKRFKERLKDPQRQWKISEADYSEREYWKEYQTAYEDIFAKCNTQNAPWFIVPSDHKWFRDLAVAQIIVDTLKSMDIKLPKPSVNIDEIKIKYHAAFEKEQKKEKHATSTKKTSK